MSTSNSSPYAELIKSAETSSQSKLKALHKYKPGNHWGSSASQLGEYGVADTVQKTECAIIAMVAHINNSCAGLRPVDLGLTSEEKTAINQVLRIGERIALEAFAAPKGRMKTVSDVIRSAAAERGVRFS